MSLLSNEQQDEAPAYLSNPDVSQTTAFMKDVLEKIKVMRKLEFKAIELQEQADKAKQDYEKYKASTVVAAMTSAGVYTLQDENGLTIKLENNYFLQPNKNDADRKLIAEWLKKQGGDHLLKHQGIVPEGELEKLKAANIPFDDKTDVNTNSLKAFLLDALGVKKGGVAKIKLEDIPECMHFVVAQDVKVVR